MTTSRQPRVPRVAARLDSWFGARGTTKQASGTPSTIAGLPVQYIETSVGPVRLVDTESERACVLIVPDGPNVIEHYAALIQQLAPSLRVVCFDMPGFGFSAPRADYQHTLDQGAKAVLGVLDKLRISRATLAFSCANGFYALRAARLDPRVVSLFLSQTPSLHAMHAWTKRVVPLPLRVPVLGQATAALVRRRLVRGWYDIALPRETPREPYVTPALSAIDHGACFSLAGVVQGLVAESQALLEGVTVPTTLLWGNQDHSHKHTDPSTLQSLVPHAELVRLDRTGHFPDL
ncbi:MAG: alpha/beta hydrolase, partial [Polyangiales bacterium]